VRRTRCCGDMLCACRPLVEEFAPSAALYAVSLPDQAQPFSFQLASRHTAAGGEQQRAAQQTVFDTADTR
jgi:hypothetical protein